MEITQQNHTEVAATILEQLGGNKFLAMTGSKNLISSPTEIGPALTMVLRKNKSGAMWLRITLIQDTDTYKMEFIKYTSRPEPSYPVVNELNNVYADQLQSIFTSVTGLLTSMGTMGR